MLSSELTRSSEFGVRVHGHMASFLAPEAVPLPLASAVGEVRTVPPDGEHVRTCRALGISFGDERQLTTVVV
jgi:hypothetical protein